MILIIDNYDSFTYNLVQYFEELGARTKVFRNNQISLQRIKQLKPKRIIISPGPCTPNEAGISTAVVAHFSGKLPLLGVCLGHQCIAAAFGGKIVRASRIMHGKISNIYHQRKNIFKKLPIPFEATRYHSLIIDRKYLPSSLIVTAWTSQREIMAVSHKKHPTFGVQFHPESILTTHGKMILSNFLTL